MPKRVSAHVDLPSLLQKAESFTFACRVIEAHGAGRVVAGFALVTNSAFACEAFMKALTLAERRLAPLETHNLKHLFFDLTEQTRSQIEKRFEDEILPSLQSGYKTPGLPKGLVPPNTFKVALERSARAFIDFRYANQSKKPMPYHLLSLPTLLRERLYEVRPDLKRTYRVSSVSTGGH